jgi:hypothetical protein
MATNKGREKGLKPNKNKHLEEIGKQITFRYIIFETL